MQAMQPYEMVRGASDESDTGEAEGGRQAGKKRGRHFINAEERYCRNCGTRETTLWRRSKAGSQLLCNACGTYERLHDSPRPFGICQRSTIRTRRRNRRVSTPGREGAEAAPKSESGSTAQRAAAKGEGRDAASYRPDERSKEARAVRSPATSAPPALQALQRQYSHVSQPTARPPALERTASYPGYYPPPASAPVQQEAPAYAYPPPRLPHSASAPSMYDSPYSQQHDRYCTCPDCQRPPPHVPAYTYAPPPPPPRPEHPVWREDSAPPHSAPAAYADQRYVYPSPPPSSTPSSAASAGAYWGHEQRYDQRDAYPPHYAQPHYAPYRPAVEVAQAPAYAPHYAQHDYYAHHPQAHAPVPS